MMPSADITLYTTKGIEYVLIMFYLAALLWFCMLFFKRETRGHSVLKAVDASDNLMNWFRVPDDVVFHQGHTWAKLDPQRPNTYFVGMDDFAHKLIGKIDKISLKEKNSDLSQGEEGWRLTADGKTVSMLSPLSGKVIETNSKAIGSTDAGSDAPYDGDWVFRVEANNTQKDLNHLISGSVARKWIDGETEKLRSAMKSSMGLVYQDGGVPVKGVARNISPDHWPALLSEIFLTKEL